MEKITTKEETKLVSILKKTNVSLAKIGENIFLVWNEGVGAVITTKQKSSTDGVLVYRTETQTEAFGIKCFCRSCGQFSKAELENYEKIIQKEKIRYLFVRHADCANISAIEISRYKEIFIPLDIPILKDPCLKTELIFLSYDKNRFALYIKGWMNAGKYSKNGGPIPYPDFRNYTNKKNQLTISFTTRKKEEAERRTDYLNKEIEKLENELNKRKGELKKEEIFLNEYFF